MAHSARRVLVIENDLETANQLVDCLQTNGYFVDLATDGEEGLRQCRASDYVAMTVDRMLPRIDGIDVIRRLRESGILTPALILSALGEVDDRVRGLRAGGDDYLVKPFAFSEMLARVDALARRSATVVKEVMLRVGDCNAEQRQECGVAGLATVEAEHKPVEVGLQMGTAQAVVDVQGPDFEVGEDAVDPGRTTAILPMDADCEQRREHRVSGPSLGFGGRARRKVAGNERMQTVGRVVGHLGETDPAGPAIPDRTDDDDLALVTASDTTRYRTGERIAVGRHHAVAQLGADQPTRLVRARASGRCSCKCRDAVGMGRDQIAAQNQMACGSLEWCKMVPVHDTDVPDVSDQGLVRPPVHYSSPNPTHCRRPSIVSFPWLHSSRAKCVETSLPVVSLPNISLA